MKDLYCLSISENKTKDRYVIRVLEMAFPWLHVSNFHLSFLALTVFSGLATSLSFGHKNEEGKRKKIIPIICFPFSFSRSYDHKIDL